MTLIADKNAPAPPLDAPTGIQSLLPTQRKLLQAVQSGDYRLFIWVGSIRSGKGVGAAYSLVSQAVDARMRGVAFDDNTYIVAGHTQGSFINNNGAYLYQAARRYGLDCVFKKSSGGHTGHYELGPGWARFMLYGGGDQASYQSLRGLTARAAWIDEITLVDEMFFTTARERLSFDESFTICTSNSGTPAHWLFADYLDGEVDGVLSLETDFDENIYYSDKQREWLKGLNPNTANYRRAILNEWVPDEGLIIPIDEKSIVRGHVDVVLRGTVSIDPGVASVTAALIVVPYRGKLLVAQNYYHRGDREGRLTDEQHLNAILGRWRADRLIIDPSGAPMRALAMQKGYYAAEGKNDKELGWQVVNNALYAGELFVHESCKELLMEAAAYRFNPRETMPEVGADHLMDCLRYAAVDLFPAYAAQYARSRV